MIQVFRHWICSQRAHATELFCTPLPLPFSHCLLKPCVPLLPVSLYLVSLLYYYLPPWFTLSWDQIQLSTCAFAHFLFLLPLLCPRVLLPNLGTWTAQSHCFNNHLYTHNPTFELRCHLQFATLFCFDFPPFFFKLPIKLKSVCSLHIQLTPCVPSHCWQTVSSVTRWMPSESPSYSTSNVLLNNSVSAFPHIQLPTKYTESYFMPNSSQRIYIQSHLVIIKINVYFVQMRKMKV